MQRATWTDERLGDLNRRVESSFDRVDARFAQVDARFAQVDTRFNQIDARFNSLESRIDTRFETAQTRTDAQFASLHRLIVQVGGGGIATLVLGFVGLVVAHA